MLFLRQLRSADALWACALVLVGVGAAPSLAQARNMEPGRLFVGLHAGVGARLPTPLLASPAAGAVGLSGEYTLGRAGSLVADASIALGHTTFVLGAAGVRGRLHDLGLAISPWAQAQFAAGALIDVMGADVPWLGARLAAGNDYFLTGNSTVSLAWVTALGGTVSDRAAFYGMMQALLTVSYGRALPRRPAPNPLPAWGA